MAAEPPAPAVTESTLRHLREYVAAGIAVVVVLGTIALMGLTFVYIEDDQLFGRAKDLLLILNPFVGVVIGYYFNKASTEARAENAEATAQAAAASARQAAQARNRAEAEAERARSKAEEAMASLTEMTRAAEEMLARTPVGAPGTLDASDRGTPGEDPRVALRVALGRARRLTG